MSVLDACGLVLAAGGAILLGSLGVCLLVGIIWPERVTAPCVVCQTHHRVRPGELCDHCRSIAAYIRRTSRD